MPSSSVLGLLDHEDEGAAFFQNFFKLEIYAGLSSNEFYGFAPCIIIYNINQLNTPVFN
jgi:hypothetical protein